MNSGHAHGYFPTELHERLICVKGKTERKRTGAQGCLKLSAER